MDRAGDLVDRCHFAYLIHHRQQRCVGDDRAGRQSQPVDIVHQVAEDRTLSAAGGDGAVFHSFFDPLRQRRVDAELPDTDALLMQTAAGDRNRIGLPVDLDRGNCINRGEDALVANPAEGQMLWRIAQGHEGDEFAFVEIQRQRVFAGDRGGNRLTMLVDRIDHGGDRARLAGEFDRLHDAADGGGQPPI